MPLVLRAVRVVNTTRGGFREPAVNFSPRRLISTAAGYEEQGRRGAGQTRETGREKQGQTLADGGRRASSLSLRAQPNTLGPSVGATCLLSLPRAHCVFG